MSEEQLNSALNLMRRMPPSSVENSLAGLIELVPVLMDDLLNHVDQPLKVQRDTKAGRDFVLCDYNRDGDSHRSPWSNAYYPPQDDGFLPSAALRKMETEANDIFDTYRKLYFEGGTSSVYFFNTDEKDNKSFGACFLIHKDVDPKEVAQSGAGAAATANAKDKGLDAGWWDSIHVFEVSETNKKGHFEYKLTTTVMVSMSVKNSHVGEVDLSGNMTQQDTKVFPVTDLAPHIGNLGRMLEDMELKIRNSIEGIYIQKTREVVNGMRSAGAQKEKEWGAITASLNAAVLKHGDKRVKDSES
jgi:capping protein beta